MATVMIVGTESSRTVVVYNGEASLPYLEAFYSQEEVSLVDEHLDEVVTKIDQFSITNCPRVAVHNNNGGQTIEIVRVGS